MHVSLLYPVTLILVLSLACYRRIVVTTSLVATYLRFPTDRVPEVDPLSLPPLRHNQSNEQPSIPRVIHHVLLGTNYSMRPDWTAATEACERLHPDWQVRLWTDREGDEFVKDAYGDEMFRLYRSYEQEIMRANVLRYMIIHAHGGVFLDLDIACRTSLEPLRQAMSEQGAMLTPQAQPTGVNNAFIMAPPGHPFFDFLISRLAYYKLTWFSPYPTNMFSTGCHFFSTVHLLFGPGRQERLRVLPWEYRLNGHAKNALFEHLGASSWHKGDARFILSLGQVCTCPFKHCRITGLTIAWKGIERLRPVLPLLGLVFVLATAGCVMLVLHRIVKKRARQSIRLPDSPTRLSFDRDHLGGEAAKMA